MAKYVQPNIIFDSSVAFLRNVSFDSSVYLKGTAHISSPTTAGVGTPYALTVDSIGANVQIKSKQLGTMAFETSTNYYGKTAVDALIADVSSALDGRLDNIDLSLGVLNNWDISQDASIVALRTKDTNIDTSLNALWLNQLSQDASIVIERQKWIDSNRTGFVDRAETTLAFNDSTYQLTLGVTGSTFSYYRDGIKYTITGAKSVTLSGTPPAAGTYYITLTDTIGTLAASTTVWDLNNPEVLPVAIVIWNSVETPKYWVADERHTMLIDRKMHQYLHTTQGTKLVSGGTLDGPVVGGIGVTDVSNMFGVSATTIADEDIFLTLPALTKPTGSGDNYEIFFRTNASTWIWNAEDTPLLPNGVGYIMYDNNGTMTEGQAGKYYTTYLAFTDLNDLARYMIIPGRGEFATADEAKDEDVAAFDFTGLPVKEFTIAWKFVWESSAGYSSTGKVALNSAPIRVTVNSTTASTASTEAHNDLIGLQGGTSTERYHLDATQYNDYIGESEVITLINDVSTRLDGRLDNIDTSLGTIDTALDGKVSVAGDTMTGLLTLAAAGFTLDGQNITNIDTSADGFGVGLDTHIPTSAAVKSAIDSAIASGVTASNGLTENPAGNIKLGGQLVDGQTYLHLGNDQQLYIDGSLAGPFGGEVVNQFASSFTSLITKQDNGPLGSGISIQKYEVKISSDVSGGENFISVANGLNTFDPANYGIRMQFDSSAIITDTGASPKGLQYAADYSSTFATNSLITKKYSDDQDAIRDASIVTLRAVNAAQDASIVRIDASLNDTIDLYEAINASLGEYVKKAGDTMTGVLTFAAGGFTLDGVTITNIDTSADGLVTTNAGIPTSGAVKKYVDTQIGAGAAYGWNGLTKTDNSIGLGGTLNTGATVITTNGATASLQLAGLATSVLDTPLALVQDSANGDLKVRALGSMAWATATNYTLKSLFDSSISAIWTKFGYVDTSLNNIWTKLGYVDSSMATMNTWNINQDISIAAISSAQGNYVLKSGDTMSGPLIITAGGLSVTNDVSISGGLLVQQGLIVNNNAYIAGTLTIDGSLLVRDVETIDVSSGFIRLNTGTTGTPPPTMQAGIIIERGNENPYVFIFDETNDTFRIGIANELAGPSFNDASTQAVATREDAPTSFGVPFWNSTNFKFETSAGFLFTPGVGLGLPIATNMGSEATALVWDGTTVGSRELGSNAFNSNAYVLQSLFDSSITAIWTKFGHVDTSLNNLGIKNAAQDTSIANLDLLTQVHTAAINDLSTNKLDAVASATGGSYTLYAGEANNVAYIKQLIAGTGATITQDGSTVTIGVTGAAGYVSKYKGTFDGTAASPFVITSGTHGLGTGPFTVSVFESGAQVYTGVDFNGSGDITLSWSPGSLIDASCKFIITG